MVGPEWRKESHAIITIDCYRTKQRLSAGKEEHSELRTGALEKLVMWRWEQSGSDDVESVVTRSSEVSILNHVRCTSVSGCNGGQVN